MNIESNGRHAAKALSPENPKTNVCQMYGMGTFKIAEARRSLEQARDENEAVSKEDGFICCLKKLLITTAAGHHNLQLQV